MSLIWLAALVVVLLALAVFSVRRLATLDERGWVGRFGTPLLFGAWVLVFWELLTQALDVPRVLLPAPSVIGHSLLIGWPVLAGDFVQTVLHSALIGLVAGCSLGFVTGVLIDRSPFLQRGLLPLASLASAVPLIGIAPIMVMWFGFDWESKAAVVVIMTFFPMLVNTLAGLAESGHMERDLMRSYGASYWRTLFSLRIPVALPFLFPSLRVGIAAGLVGAIVGELPTGAQAGLGARLLTGSYYGNTVQIWSALVMSALLGLVLTGAVAFAERALTPGGRK